jgi:phage terminase large subunit GpA-like protein
MQELIFEYLIWDKGHTESAQYCCSSCGAMIEERSKTTMLLDGEWRSMVPEKRCDDRIGFHLNSLYSPLGWMSWAEIADMWEKAQEDTNLLRVFINTILGETWKEKGDAPAWTALYDRREKLPLNAPKKDVVFITGGADVQKDRIEIEIVGWCRKKISYSLDYRVLLGDTSSKNVWDKLADIVNESWKRDDGVLLPMKLMAVDTGYNTTEVYEFARRFDASRVIPVKGQDKQSVIISSPKYVDVNTKTGKKGKLKLFHVGVSLLKSELYGWLRLRIEQEVEPAGYCHFPEYGEDYFKGITAEELKFKISKGYRQYYWEKRFARNEPLDCRNYARAAASIVGMDRFNEAHWNNMDSGHPMPKKPDSTKKKKRDSSIWNR